MGIKTVVLRGLRHVPRACIDLIQNCWQLWPRPWNRTPFLECVIRRVFLFCSLFAELYTAVQGRIGVCCRRDAAKASFFSISLLLFQHCCSLEHFAAILAFNVLLSLEAHCLRQATYIFREDADNEMSDYMLC